MPIRVMLVDDHDVIRSGLQAVLELEDDVEVVAEAASGEEALARLCGRAVDVVLLDLLMPGMGGLKACREILDAYQDTRVLILTSSSDEEAVLSALMAGASGYLLKNVGRQDLVQAIRVVAGGKSTLDPAITEKVTRRLVEALGAPAVQEGTQAAAALSEREVEVVRLVARGFTNKQIASELIIAEKTARNHISRILDKLGMARRSQAAAWAIQHGIVTDSVRQN